MSTDSGYTDAFQQGYKLGFDCGYEVGDAHGYNRCGLEYTAALTGVRQALGGPSQDELDRARTRLRNCSCGRCSTCCRRSAIERNRARYGSDDYPGASCTPSRNAERGAA